MFTIADSSNPAIPFEAWMQTASEKGYILSIFSRPDLDLDRLKSDLGLSRRLIDQIVI